MVVADKRKLMRTTVDGAAQPDQTEVSHTELDAMLRVLAVDARGRPTRSEFTVTRLARDERALLEGGRVVQVTTAERGADATITVDGRPAEAPVREALDAVILLETQSALTDDDIFGSQQPRAVGATWPIDGPRASNDLRDESGIAATLTGESHLVRRLMSRQTDCIEVEGVMHGPVTAIPGLPPGMTLQSGTLEAHFRNVLPVAVEQSPHEGGDNVTMNVTVAGTDEGHALRIVFEFQEAKRRTETVV